MPANHLAIRDAWRQYIAGSSLNVHLLSPEIARSWQRCHNLNVDPQRTRPYGIDRPLLEERRFQRQRLLKIVRPVMERIYDYVRHTGFQVLLSDECGFLLDVVGDPDITVRAEAVELCPGGNWSEEFKGTNAIGTAIFERKPVQVFASEHYCAPNQFLICSASPIFDAEARMVGVLDVSGDYRYANVHTLAMVVAAVGSIENELRLQRASGQLFAAYRYSNILLENMSDGLISVDNRGVITEINARGAEILGVNPGRVKGQPLAQIAGEHSVLLQFLREGGEEREQLIVVGHAGRKVRVAASLLRDEDGLVIGAVATMHEISHRASAARPLALVPVATTCEEIVGSSAVMQRLRERMRVAAASASTVLLEGESGTGKELAARAIHAGGRRRHAPFVALNCAALPETLIESELFGYEEGSFTGARRGGQPGKFELAHGGTLFLDEVGDMPLSAQSKLLRALQERSVIRLGSRIEREVDIRIIAATLRDLRQEVREGRFRQDLYYRLDVLRLDLPPLRAHLEDLPTLVEQLAERIARRLEVEVKPLGDGVLERLAAYDWPGNVRELENAIERAINLAADAPRIEVAHFELRPALVDEAELRDDMSAPLSLVQMEREMIHRALAHFHGNIQQAATSLGISRNTLYRKLKEYPLAMPIDDDAESWGVR